MICNDNAYENRTIRSENPSFEGFFIKKSDKYIHFPIL